MKPTLPVDEKSSNVTVVMQQPRKDNESRPTKSSNKRLIIGIVSGITLLLVVLAAVLVAVFLGAEVTKDSRKEAWLNYRDPNGEKRSEHVVVDDREEDYTVPNKMRVIYDFQKGYAVHKFEKNDNDEEDNFDNSLCYVSHFNQTHLATPEQLKDSLSESEIDVPSNLESNEVTYYSSGQQVDRDDLSPRAREMCKDSKVVWMAKTAGEEKKKRSTANTEFKCSIVFYVDSGYVRYHYECYLWLHR